MAPPEVQSTLAFVEDMEQAKANSLLDARGPGGRAVRCVQICRRCDKTWTCSKVPPEVHDLCRTCEARVRAELDLVQQQSA